MREGEIFLLDVVCVVIKPNYEKCRPHIFMLQFTYMELKQIISLFLNAKLQQFLLY